MESMTFDEAAKSMPSERIVAIVQVSDLATLKELEFAFEVARTAFNSHRSFAGIYVYRTPAGELGARYKYDGGEYLTAPL